MIKLFLDDFRIPQDCFYYINNAIYNENDWIIVRSYDEFCDYITKNGLENISIISFDHDLADVHYEREQNDEIDYSSYKEKTGYECAKWLCEYIMNNDIDAFPEYLVHSMNSVGRNNIIGYIESFRKNVLNE